MIAPGTMMIARGQFNLWPWAEPREPARSCALVMPGEGCLAIAARPIGYNHRILFLTSSGCLGWVDQYDDDIDADVTFL